MKVTIQDYSIESAFRRIHEELTEGQVQPDPSHGFINVTDNEGVSDLSKFEGTGVVFGRTIEERGENVNDAQTQVINHPTKGAKKYKTIYLAVYDHKKGMELYPDAKADNKGDCVDKCREESARTGRNLFVIIGKTTDGFDRMGCRS